MAKDHNQEPRSARYGLDNPHPLSQLETELVWEGKYDEYGNRRAVDVAGCAMPLQKIETINEPRSRAAAEGRKDRSLKTVSEAGIDKCPKPDKYSACTKVVDVFGCDRSIMVEVMISSKETSSRILKAFRQLI